MRRLDRPERRRRCGRAPRPNSPARSGAPLRSRSSGVGQAVAAPSATRPRSSPCGTEPPLLVGKSRARDHEAALRSPASCRIAGRSRDSASAPASDSLHAGRATRFKCAPRQPAPQVVRQRRLTLVSPTSATPASAANTSRPDLVAAGELLGVAQARGEIEPADAAGHADEAGHDADLRRNRCGTSWKTAPLPMPSASMPTMKTRQRHPRLRQMEADHDDERHRRDDVHDRSARECRRSGRPSAPPTGRTSDPANTQAAVK